MTSIKEIFEKFEKLNNALFKSGRQVFYIEATKLDWDNFKSSIQKEFDEQARQIFDDIFLESDSNQLEDYDDCVLTYNEFELLKKKWCKE